MTGARCSGGASATWLVKRTGAATCSRPSNLFPTKQRDGKIDRAVALMMAIGRAQASESDGAEDITAFLLNPVMG